VITRPSPGLTMKGRGPYEISGLAWSGYGKSPRWTSLPTAAKSWALAALQEPVLAKALTRFRIPWRWNGGPRLAKAARRRVGLCSADARPVAREPGMKLFTSSMASPAGAVGETERTQFYA